MEEVDGSVSVGECNSGTRKKRKQVSARQQSKTLRYSESRRALVFHPCPHNTKKFSCAQFRPRHLKCFNSYFYSKPDKTRQDNIIGNLIQIRTVKRRRPRPVAQNKRKKQGGERAFNVSYFLPTENGCRIPVCKKFFRSITKVSGKRLGTILHRVNSGQAIEERRGGDRRSMKNTMKKESVREFIRKLRGTESHYNRKKSKRIYLSSELSIRKLHSIYNDQASEDLKVKCSMFRKIFVTEFNIGFKSPASDTCSTCCLLKEKIKNAPLGSHERMRLMVEKRVHTQRAKAFYAHMKENVPDSTTFCFDLQQIQPLPKCPIQEAFYARQVNFYNLCVTDLATKHPIFYTWTEEQAGKGSIEISSALLHHLMTVDFNGNSTLRLFSDGCVSQNKNNIVLRTLIHFLQKTETSIKKILLFFPVRGHSFLPADRVFGRSEKIIRKKPIVLTKEEYYECYENVGEIKVLGKDWVLYDTKSLRSFYKDLEQISEVKRIVIKVKEDGDVMQEKERTSKKKTKKRAQARYTESKQIIVRGLMNYRFEGDNEKFISLRKKGRLKIIKIRIIGTLVLYGGHPYTARCGGYVMLGWVIYK
jgi:hypothetical protein